MIRNKYISFILIIISTVLAMPSWAENINPSGIVDTIVFGSSSSERSHKFSTTKTDSEVLSGGLGEPARRLLPKVQPDWEGGRMAFTLKVDPAKANYVTVKLWGSDVIDNRLVLFCDGKQVGYHCLGDVDNLDFGNDTGQPAYNDRFVYITHPLPLQTTQGKKTLRCEIRSLGRIWSYGTTFNEYQKPLTDPTRGVYRLYTHTDGCFVPPASEKQGAAATNPPVRKAPGEEVITKIKERVNRQTSDILNSAKPIDQVKMHFIAKAYYVKWTQAYNSEKTVHKVMDGIDALYAAYHKNPSIAVGDPAMYNTDWFGLAFAADSVRMLIDAIKPHLDEEISDGAGGKVTRRAVWSKMFQDSRDLHRRARRQYTNQSMIVDTSIYMCNRGVAAIDPANAAPEEDMLHFLYQSIGLEPWLGSDTDSGPAKPLGDNYLQLTAKGLTKELGYVGYYGEVIDWVTMMYDATRMPGQEGDPKIKAQLIKISRARAPFRYPALDRDGNRTMRVEAICGWRDAHYPGDIVYAERIAWDGSAIYEAAVTLDPQSVGAAQQMFDDNQFFDIELDFLNRYDNVRVNANLLMVPDQYELLKSQPKSSLRLPMADGQPDFVFSDEEDGVVAIKHGSDILYTSLYWRARYAVNSLARVHYITPSFDRVATVREDTIVEPSGMTYVTPCWIDRQDQIEHAVFAIPDGGFTYGDIHSAHSGEVLPVAKLPEGVKYMLGQENSYAGKAIFYKLRYGNYLIAMNTTTDRSFDLEVPQNEGEVKNLTAADKNAPVEKSLKVGPRSTVVLYFGK